MGKADYRLLVEVGVQQAVAGALVNEFSEPSVLVGYSLAEAGSQFGVAAGGHHGL